jgi:hypothetical protein
LQLGHLTKGGSTRPITGDKTNAFWLNLLRWLTVAAIFTPSAGLVVSRLVRSTACPFHHGTSFSLACSQSEDRFPG